jgi:hypothetical protein
MGKRLIYEQNDGLIEIPALAGIFLPFSHFLNKFLVGVPGRTKILSHIGNFPLDTKGCLLPGLSYANDFVGYSGDASGKLLDLFSSKSRFVINIY